MMRIGLLLSVLLLMACPQPGRADDRLYDVVIYGGTSAAVAAAVQAARDDLSVVLVAPGWHVGGLTSSGLGQTDSGDKRAIGGVSREFYQRIRQYYRNDEAWRHERRDDYLGGGHLPRDGDAQWGFEPHVAEKVFRQMLDEHQVPVVFDERLDLRQGRGVPVQGQRIMAIVMESGRTFRGRIFVDATYEGDLMAKAGVGYTVGRESNATYDETLNGIQKANTRNHVFTQNAARTPDSRVDPYVVAGDPESGLLPGINPDDPGEDGDGDHRVQAYCYRLCLTDVPENRVPFEKPEGYREIEYELLFRMFEAGERRIPWLPGRMPNRKTDTNNRWAVSLNYIGYNYDYPDAGYDRRREIEQAHARWQRGVMWALAHHERVPAHVRNEVSRWGLARDEFAHNDHWPHQIYVREARRMVGDYVMTEQDCRRLRIAEDSVGLGSYNMDSHNVQRYVTPDGYVQNEGNIEVSPGGAYAISYRSIVPKRDEVDNLFVPVCISASHIAFGSIRMEPVFMILGHSAATAAKIAIDGDLAVQDVPYDELREKLVEQGQVLELGSREPRFPSVPLDPAQLGGIVMDVSHAQLVGQWTLGNVVFPHTGEGYRHDENSGKGTKRIIFTFQVPETGRYQVGLGYNTHANRATNVPVTVQHADGQATVQVNQQKAQGLFHRLGVYRFDAGRSYQVEISNADTDGYVVVDALQLLPLTP